MVRRMDLIKAKQREAAMVGITPACPYGLEGVGEVSLQHARCTISCRGIEVSGNESRT